MDVARQHDRLLIRGQPADHLLQRYLVGPPALDFFTFVARDGRPVETRLGRSLDVGFQVEPCGGGGLLSGSAIAAKGVDSNCRVIGIEPELADDATKSYHTKKLHSVKNPPTIADGTRTPSLGEVTFPLVLKFVDDMRTVSEKTIVEAVKFLFFRMKLVVEPSGALGVAALLNGSVKPKGRIGVIISGGNIDGSMMRKILD